MDHHLRRLRQELLSMKEVGDGLQQQMDCMMGALQELKLLQLQAALEQLHISGSPSTLSASSQQQCCPSSRATASCWQEESSLEEHSSTALTCALPHPAALAQPAVLLESHQLRDTSSCFSSLCREAGCHPKGLAPALSRAEQVLPRTCKASSQGRAGGWPAGCDDGHDWTSSLMSQSRNRQPLVLGDNIFADLVGNWLDLPELEQKGEKHEGSLATSRSQELCRKFSLTANIFKKFLRSVRPDRDRLLKEKPCWLPPEDKQPAIARRPKKMNKLKGTFYFPLHGKLQSHHSKAERCPKAEGKSEKPKGGSRKAQDAPAYSQPGFDINTAVWV